MGPDGRVAVDYAPAPDDPLFIAGARWLGRDPQTGAACPQPDLPCIAEITAEPRRYGFHATLKPPMRLLPGLTWSDVLIAAQKLADAIAPFPLPGLAVCELHGFLALREQAPCPQLQFLADRCVEMLDRFRAPADPTETAGRLCARLSTAQEAMLALWGYPYVFEQWFFHMTLTRRLSEAEHAVWYPAAAGYFADALRRPRSVTDICLFVQPAPEAPFTISARLKLRG